ncbi:hypothetical protein Asppvi_005131 [Aspergillus pseudoviridinutans]|uniref:Uncharacterized protein n=1 Tax=Aspergillus pseudoviridinutans TaxID=1517512 RepID=A0A9P3EUY4_9EURO|nr:uncharacterized protein Asppvi_005131 [Aspergillus pseudoviridinutans]GIJ86245.1 hypothetical protein Asppvi_005131 [Aspergillus pseudoviridinutans]
MIALDNSGNGTLRVPGFGSIPLDYELPSDARFAHGIQEWRQAPAVTARELAMVAVMNRLTDLPNWYIDVFDDAIVACWRQNPDVASIATNPLLSDRAWDWCLRELRDKAEEYQRQRHIRVLDTGSCICKSDDVPGLQKDTGALADEIQSAVKIVLQKGSQFGLLDWRSKRRLSIVDPMLFPLVYGRSLVLTDGGRVELEDVLGAYSGATTIAPMHVDLRTDAADVQKRIEEAQQLHLGVYSDTETSPHYRWSANYQALPCEVEFVGDKGSTQVRITSYINNLHPAHRDLYRAIETLVSRAIPLWNDCLVQGQRGWRDILNQGQLGPVPLRIITYGAEWENELPEWLLAFRVPSKHRKKRYRQVREVLLSSEGDTTDEGRRRYREAQELLEGLADVEGNEDKELPPLDSNLWQHAKEYLQLPEGGSATPVPVPDDWQQFPWGHIERKLRRLLHFRHPEPGTSFSYDEWKTGRHHERAVVDMVRERKDWHHMPYKPVTPPHKYYTIRLQDTFREHGLQIIVKMENIELTPDSGSYKGTDWRMEGQLNEHLVAAAVFAYDVVNITEPRIAFRQNTKLDESFYQYREDREQGRKENPRRDVPARRCGKDFSTEFAAVAEILGFSTIDLDCDNHAVKTWQDKGTVRVSQGRLVTFPNLLEHRYEPFTLADPSRPGHFRSIALYLVDPHYRVCSTRNVPPQQHHWWAQAVSHDLAAAGLPQEIVDEIMQGTDSWPMGLPEARRHRREFLKEHRWNNLVRIHRMDHPYFNC